MNSYLIVQQGRRIGGDNEVTWVDYDFPLTQSQGVEMVIRLRKAHAHFEWQLIQVTVKTIYTGR